MNYFVGITFEGNTEICVPSEELLQYEESRTGKDMSKYTSVMLHKSNERYNPCRLINSCLDLLKESDDADVKRMYETIATFITEANNHPEYCDKYLLTKFKDYIYQAMDGYQEPLETDSQTIYETDGLKLTQAQIEGLTRAITVADIEQMHNSSTPDYEGRDVYTCQSETIEFLAIQIIYACLLHYFKQGNRIRICEVCGRVFVPKGRMKSCNEPCPFDKTLTCAKYHKKQQQAQWHDEHPHYNTISDRLYKRKDSALNRGDDAKAEELDKLLKEFQIESGQCDAGTYPGGIEALIEKWKNK